MYKLTLGRVHDLLELREGQERLFLRVDADPAELVRLINGLEHKLSAINADNAETEGAKVGREFCEAIFGKDQTGKIFTLYNNDGAAVLGLCTKYFTERLWKKITKAQKRARV